jgi:hypothetical protein
MTGEFHLDTCPLRTPPLHSFGSSGCPSGRLSARWPKNDTGQGHKPCILSLVGSRAEWGLTGYTFSKETRQVHTCIHQVKWETLKQPSRTVFNLPL